MGLVATTATVESAINMVKASNSSYATEDIGKYLDSRRNEAIFSADFLKAQTPEIDSERTWTLVCEVAVSGIYLDTLFDAKEDSKSLPQFTASQIAIGAGRRLSASLRGLGGDVVLAISKASIENGLMGHMIRELPKKISA
jgi:hypothetical protein